LLWKAMVWALIDWYIWAALAPLVLRLARRYRLERPKTIRNLLIHLPASIIIAFIHMILLVKLPQLFIDPGATKATFWESLKITFAVNFHWDLFTYWMILSVGMAFDYYRKYQERELKASQLEARLAQAQLQALRMQLHPHFLFNTLHAISAL